MPKVFLVKRRTPGVSVRSWDELPDEKRADTYIPGERRSGPGLGVGFRGGGGGGRVRLVSRPGLGSPPQTPSWGVGREVSEARKDREREAGKARRSAPPSP